MGPGIFNNDYKLKNSIFIIENQLVINIEGFWDKQGMIIGD